MLTSLGWDILFGSTLRIPGHKEVRAVEPALNRIQHGDCIEGLKKLPAGAVDLAFALEVPASSYFFYGKEVAALRSRRSSPGP